MKEQWRKDMQHKLADYRKAAPEISWSEVEKAVAAQKASSRHEAKTIPMWGRRIAAAAAVILLVAGIGYISFNRNKASDANRIAQNRKWDGGTDKKTNERQTGENEEGNIINRLVAAIVPTPRGNDTAILLADASVPTEQASPTTETAATVPQTAEEKKEEAKMTVARQHYYSDGNDKYSQSYQSGRKSARGISASIGISNSISGYNDSSNGGVLLAEADPINSCDNIFSITDDGQIQNMTSDFETSTHHRQPVRIGIRVRYDLNERWSVESGVTYSYLSSEINKENSYCTYNTEQKLHYVGIPVNVNYNLITTKRLNVYASAGGMAEKMVKGKATTQYAVNSQVQSTASENVKINPLQYSVNGAVGIAYQVGGNIGIFAEPGVSYYIDNGSHVQTIYKDKPFNINLNVGLRLTIR